MLCCATVYFSYVGLHINQEFNEWQKKKSQNDDVVGKSRDITEAARSDSDTCLRIASLAVSLRPDSSTAPRALGILYAVRAQCLRGGVPIDSITAAYTAQGEGLFAKAVVQQAKIVSAKNINIVRSASLHSDLMG